MFTLAAPATHQEEIKRSRFLAQAAPVDDEAAARAFIEQVSAADANHNCWAWRIGQAYRFSDDGEPSGTAGKPMLQAIDGQALDGVVVVVTRWFGGVLLGSGGLMRAYGGAAAKCLQGAEKRRIVLRHPLTVTVGFSDLARVKARLQNVEDLLVTAESFVDTGAVLDLGVPEGGLESLETLLTDLTSGRALIHRER
ncbi:IMPACT family protein [Rhizobium sp. SG2393]|uniref:IMPACT family protein n=1 Tax=Rhizobium sp. SG2393 TaxID=3276279 RepID=UPI00366CFCB0